MVLLFNLKINNFNWLLKKMLKLFKVEQNNDKITLHTSRAIVCSGGQIITFINPIKLIRPWIGNKWIIEKESKMNLQYEELIHLYPVDKTKIPFDLWNETHLSSKLQNIF